MWSPMTSDVVQECATHLVRHGRVRRRAEEGVGEEADVTRPKEQRRCTSRFAFPEQRHFLIEGDYILVRDQGCPQRGTGEQHR